MNNTDNKVRTLTLAAVFAALILVATMFLKVPLPGNSEYAHLGDGFIYLVATILPLPYAICAAIVGAGLADVLVGAAIWAPATIMIKALMALTVNLLLHEKPHTFPRIFSAMAVSTIINVLGYYLAGGFIYGNFIAGLSSMFGTFCQSLAAVALYLVLFVPTMKIYSRK